MSPMPTSCRVFTWLCAYPAPESTNKWTNRAQIAFTFSACVVLIGCILAGAAYFIEHLRIDLEDALKSMFMTIGAIWILYLIIATIILRYRIRDIFVSLNNIYKANEETDLLHFLDEANRKSEWMWKIYAIIAIGSVLNNIMMFGASIVYCYATYGAFDTNHLFTAYKLVLPWNQTTKLGYFMEITYDIMFGSVYLLANGSLLLFFISICLHHLAFYKRFKYSISKLGDPETPENDKKLLCELIQFHNLVKGWLLETANVLSPLNLVQLITSMLVLALIVFQLDSQIKHIDFNATVIFIGALACAANLFIYCFFGKLATESYRNMADCVFDSNWLGLPLDLKKYLIMMIANAQQPIYYHGFGLARLQLETFTTLMKMVFSYYMMFKTLTRDN